MRTIQIAVVRDARYRSGDGFQVYGDGGTGVIDWVHPVTPRRLRFWEDALAMTPHLLGGHATSFHLDSIRREGHVYGTHLLDRQGQPAGTTVFAAGPFVFGRFQHAVVTQDELGNQALTGVTIHETMINSDPSPARDLRVTRYDPVIGLATFGFTPSERLAG